MRPSKLSLFSRDQRRKALALVRPYRSSTYALALLAFLGGVVEAGFLVLITRAALSIADGQGSFGFPWIGTVSAGGAIAIGVALLISRLFVSLAAARVSAKLVVRTSNAFRLNLARSFLQSSWSTQQAEPAGRLQQLVTDFSERASEIVVAFTSAISAALNLAALLVVAVILNPFATVAVVASLVILGSALAPLRRQIAKRAQSAARSQMEFARSIAELGALGQEMQAFGVRSKFIDRVQDVVDRWSQQRVRVLELTNLVLPIYTTLAYGAVVLGLGVAVVMRPSDLAGMGAVLLLMLRSLTYGQQLQAASGNLVASMPFLDELESTIERYEADPASIGSIPLGSNGELSARNVGFAYPGGEPVLRNLNFDICRGEIIGVIGPSGAGKSTLIELLLGIRDPSSGVVELDGVDLRSIDRAQWSQRVGFVAQEARLITGTVEENISFFRDDISIDAIKSAASMANISSDIEALPDKYRSHLGERGSRLSGGQRQRLSIARALAGSPDLLILDEPTSALDVRSEGLIRKTIAALRGNVTVVVIAHRMSTLDVCDRIMVVEGGEIAAFDTPGALVSRSDFYREALRISGII